MNFPQLFLTCLILLCIVSTLSAQAGSGGKKLKRGNRRRFRKSKSTTQSPPGPLMVFMLDGFRWDYYNRLKHVMPGLSRFLQQGVQAKWMNPVFPVLSYPNWASLSTGVYPETHGLIGNYMIDLNSDPSARDLFQLGDLATTTRPKWWQNSEPIWITATKNKKRSFLHYWSRCEVPFRGILPEECTGYLPAGGNQAINKTLGVGLEKLLKGFDLVMIYGEHIDNVGHRYGPDSYQMQLALVELDTIFKEFLEKLDKQTSLRKKVNIILVGDHGMTDASFSSGTQNIFLDDHIDKNDVFRAVDAGSMISIAPAKGKLESLYKKLKRIPGIDVYKRNEIPDHLHYKNDPKVFDLLLVCRPGYAIHGLQSSKQIPRGLPTRRYFGGVHGYTPSMEDQRTIFFARGPAFKKNLVHPPIDTVDAYQVYAHCLGIPPQPHNGTWANVADMLV